MKVSLLTNHNVICSTVFLISLLAFSGCNSEKTKTVDSDNKTEIKEIKPVQLSAGEMPPGLRFRGEVQEVWKWNDALGENLLVTSIVPPYEDKEKDEFDEEGETSEIHAFHYVLKDTGYKLIWKLSDLEKSCAFDITAAFIKGATIITDLDNDGVAESTLQYKLACRSDVSPSEMKVIMHEDTAKYSLRGLMWLQVSPDDKFTITENDANAEKMPKKDDEYERYLVSVGRYENEKDFKNSPPEFLAHAKKRWMKYVVETFD